MRSSFDAIILARAGGAYLFAIGRFNLIASCFDLSLCGRIVQGGSGMTRNVASPPTKFGASASLMAKQASAATPQCTAPPATKFAQAGDLQAKPAAVGQRRGPAPPATKFGPAGNLQAKPAAAGQKRGPAPPPTRFGRATTGTAPGPRGSRVVQPSLARNPFSGDTQKEVLLVKGQHRRHIIPNHLMKFALQAWYDTHHGVMPLRDLQQILDEMNNYTPNLHPGDGVQNSAIGMISTWAPRKLDKIDVSTSQPSDVNDAFSKPSGFFQSRQQETLAPVVSAFGSDPQFSKSTSSALSFAQNIVDSTDFDWPGGTPQEFEIWKRAYYSFMSLMNNGADYDHAGMLSLCKTFMSLTAPSGKHD